MITGVINNQIKGGTLVVTLPCSVYDLREYLIEEADRYRLTMENYAHACKAAEDEEYEMPEDKEWER